jgi:transposase-like protein
MIVIISTPVRMVALHGACMVQDLHHLVIISDAHSAEAAATFLSWAAKRSRNPQATAVDGTHMRRPICRQPHRRDANKTRQWVMAELIAG